MREYHSPVTYAAVIQCEEMQLLMTETISNYPETCYLKALDHVRARNLESDSPGSYVVGVVRCALHSDMPLIEPAELAHKIHNLMPSALALGLHGEGVEF